MREAMRKVYYCDHCGKRRMQRPSMEHHEAICTKNPNRHCGVCGEKYIAGKISYMKEAWGDTEHTPAGVEEFVKTARRECSECPACTLTILRCVVPKELYGLTTGDVFDFKAELKKWNADDPLREYHAEMSREAMEMNAETYGGK